MKKISDFIIYSNLLISICAACFIWETYLLLNLPMNFFCVAIGFAATLLTYNVDRLAILDFLDKKGNERHNWILRFRRSLILMSSLCMIFLVGAVFFIPFRIMLFLAHLGVISLLYSVPAFIKGTKSLRNVKLLKIFLITYVWAASTVMLPAIWEGVDIFQRNILLLFSERMLFIFAITVPFDIRDYQRDKANNVLTIPGLIGIRQSRLLALSCIVVFFLINLVQYNFSNGVLWAKLLSGINALIIIYFANESKHEYYYTGLLDGTMIVQFILVVLLR